MKRLRSSSKSQGMHVFKAYLPQQPMSATAWVQGFCWATALAAASQVLAALSVCFPCDEAASTPVQGSLFCRRCSIAMYQCGALMPCLVVAAG
jgi:hypothetical protein